VDLSSVEDKRGVLYSVFVLIETVWDISDEICVTISSWGHSNPLQNMTTEREESGTRDEREQGGGENERE
jgi:hypothetical protein